MSESVCSDNSDAESCISRTSTEMYGEHEPFETFQHRVRNLCTNLWPSIASEEFTIEHMRGGSYNRVVGIVVPSTSEVPEDRKYVLRVPRDTTDRLEPELATLRFIRDNTTIPVPEIVSFDLTCDNPLGSIYNIQKRIPGINLERIYKKLSQVERLSIIHQFAQILLDMQKLRSPIAGFPGAKDIKGTALPEVRIVDFLTKTYEGIGGKILWGGMSDDRAKLKSTYQILIDQFDGWQEFGRRCSRGVEEDELMERFRVVTRQMEKLGFLEGSDFILFHWDYYSHNILVHKLDEESEKDGNQPGWKISGVLDWDGTAFTPYAAACIPPTWIWCNWEDGEGEDEAELCKVPDDPEARERKELFDSLMGAAYTHHAYSHQHRFVRRLFGFAEQGFYSTQQEKDADKFFEDWDSFFKTTLGVDTNGAQITPKILEVRPLLEVRTINEVESSTEVDTRVDTKTATMTATTKEIKEDQVPKDITFYGKVFGTRLKHYCAIQ